MFRSLFAAIALLAGLSTGAGAEGPGKEHIVHVVSDYDNLRMYFKPKMLHVEPGNTVTWINEVEEDHNVVSYPDGYPKGAKPMNSPFLHKAGERWSFTFPVQDAEGTPRHTQGRRGEGIFSPALISVSRGVG